MNYHNITMDDMLNGSGLRTVLWLSGCSHKCKGCHNQITWDPNSGLIFDEIAKKELFQNLSKPHIKGITFSGGDPLHENNRNEVLSLAKEIRKLFPEKDIWLYTGYKLEEIKNLIPDILDEIDVLVDDKFVLELFDANLEWKGSSNQTVHFLKEKR